MGHKKITKRNEEKMNDNKEFQRIRLQVGEHNFRAGTDFSEVEFMGVTLVSRKTNQKDRLYDNTIGTEWGVYLTPHAKIAVYKRDWNRFYGGNETAELKIYNDINEIEGIIPLGLLKEAKQALNINIVEYLDV